ncbi:hypothetical protein PIB30_084530, partial [Stylosanthes scabra]|nr:hypothetical protein [Stylosanthes scabra]
MRESGASSQQRSRLSTALMRGLLLNPRTHQSPHAYAPVVKLMRGQACRVTPCVAQLSKRQQSSRICVNIIEPLTHM